MSYVSSTQTKPNKFLCYSYTTSVYICRMVIIVYSDAYKLNTLLLFCYFFFFQAEDGIRDYKVTGVQTCALPICWWPRCTRATGSGSTCAAASARAACSTALSPSAWGSQRSGSTRERAAGHRRSEERRVGKEGRSRWSPYH